MQDSGGSHPPEDPDTSTAFAHPTACAKRKACVKRCDLLKCLLFRVFLISTGPALPPALRTVVWGVRGNWLPESFSEDLASREA